MPLQNQHLFQNNERFELVLQGINAGVYEFNFDNRASYWSTKFYELLGYKHGEILPSREALLDQLIIPKDRIILSEAFESSYHNKEPFLIETQLLHRAGTYRWYKITGQSKWIDQKPEYLIGSLTDIENRVSLQIENNRNRFLLEEAGLMAKVGGWELNLENLMVTWSKEVCLIHELPEGYQPTLAEGISFYHPDHVPLIQNAVEQALENGIPFDLELKIITAAKRERWVRAIGKAIYDNYGKITGLRGVFQDIEEQKIKTLDLQASQNLVFEQNKRLVNFAHIISHNLRSYAGNLKLTLDLMEMEDDPEEYGQLKGNLRKISESLDQTMDHLNEIVAVQTETNAIKRTVSFEEVFLRVIDTLKTEIELAHADIRYQFDACSQIEYISAYLESILLNLVSNAIKYKNPDKPLVIHVKTYLEQNKSVLEVSDNGLGIDLSKYGEKLFGMYKTFHNNSNARGIGLFITKNQVEAMGGKIEVKSEINKGSTFKVIF